MIGNVITLKTDKASEKGLHKTERDVRLGTRDLALILKATLEEGEGDDLGYELLLVFRRTFR